MPDFSDKITIELSSRLGQPVSNVNFFLAQSDTTIVLTKLLQLKNLKLDAYERAFLFDKHMPVLAKNGLLFALLYPDLCPPNTPFFSRVSLYHRLDSFFEQTPLVHFLYVNEFALGINHFDATLQNKALMLLRKNPSLVLREIRYLTNLAVYSFEKKNGIL